MNNFYIFIIRLILGLILGMIIARIFRPDWGMAAGACLGMGLVVAAYLMQLIRRKISDS